MMNVIARSGNVASYFKATTCTVSSGLNPAAIAIPVKGEKLQVKPTPLVLTKRNVNDVLFSGKIGVQSGIGGNIIDQG